MCNRGILWSHQHLVLIKEAAVFSDTSVQQYTKLHGATSQREATSMVPATKKNLESRKRFRNSIRLYTYIWFLPTFVTNFTISLQTVLINITLLLTPFHSDMFQLSKSHLQEVRQKHFKSKANEINYQM
jgi:hypothetical protein